MSAPTGRPPCLATSHSCLDAAGTIDLRKLDPIALALDTRGRSSVEAGGYFAFGERIGGAFSSGREFIADAKP